MKQLLLLVGAKLEHIIARLYQDSMDMLEGDDDKSVKPSDEYFWFTSPPLVLHLLHFILFQNSFEIAFFFWIWVRVSSISFPFQISLIFTTIIYLSLNYSLCSAHMDLIHALWRK